MIRHLKACAAGAVMLLGLAACGVTPAGQALKAGTDIAEAETQQERAVLSQIARDDLEEALRAAEFHNDIIAAACWRQLLVTLDEFGGDGFFTEPKGAFSAYQKARNVRRKLSAGISDELKLACVPLKEDAKSAVLDIARTVGLPIPDLF